MKMIKMIKKSYVHQTQTVPTEKTQPMIYRVRHLLALRVIVQVKSQGDKSLIEISKI